MSSVNSFLPFKQNQSVFDTDAEPGAQLVTDVFRMAAPSAFFKLTGVDGGTVSATLQVTNNYDDTRPIDTVWQSVAVITSDSTVADATVSTPYIYGRLIITGGKGRIDVSITDALLPVATSSEQPPTSVTADQPLPMRLENHDALLQGDRVTTEPLGYLGEGKQIDVSAGGGTVALTSSCTRFTVVARGGDIRIAMGSTIPSSSTGALLMENGERDYACAQGSSIAAIKAAHEDAGTVVLEIIELI